MYGFVDVPLPEVGPVITTLPPAFLTRLMLVASGVSFAITTWTVTPREAARATALTTPVEYVSENSSPSTSSVCIEESMRATRSGRAFVGATTSGPLGVTEVIACSFWKISVASATSVASVSVARYSRVVDGELVFAFIVMIHAVEPSRMIVFSCVYVNAVLDHTPLMPALFSVLYAEVLNDFVVVEPSRIAWTSRPACFFATSALITFDESISYIVM